VEAVTDYFKLLYKRSHKQLHLKYSTVWLNFKLGTFQTQNKSTWHYTINFGSHST